MSKDGSLVARTYQNLLEVLSRLTIGGQPPGGTACAVARFITRFGSARNLLDATATRMTAENTAAH